MKAIRIESFQGNDNASMAAGNTSCFNFRQITSGTIVSIHGYGLAIDLNPIQNPHVYPFVKKEGTVKILPPQGLNYLNRSNHRLEWLQMM